MPVKPKSLKTTLADAGIKNTLSRKRAEPLWKGPEVDGITQSMILSILGCPERAYLKYIEGLRPADVFNPRTEYGHMWHCCEEHFAKNEDWEPPLKVHVESLLKKYPLQQQDVIKWYNVCKLQFPVYVCFWIEHEDVLDRIPLMQEQVFNIPYSLPSGRTVTLRGKFDSIDLIGKGNNAGIYLQENKTKGDVDPVKIQRQLKFDCQTMLYLTAMKEVHNREFVVGEVSYGEYPIRGVRYNIVRRPLSGGKGSIRPHAEKRTKNTYTPAESDEHFYNRLLNDYIKAEPESYFSRFKVEVDETDISRFESEFLIPKLEYICDWYDWVTSGNRFRYGNRLHYRHPFGGYNVLDEGGSSDVDEYLENGNEVGLRRVDELFTELI